ncbi:histidine phosphatase family protein [Microbacterium sp. NPDC076911]|uniref:SixA phosphatase family protein n=1 Tax=Microbacterium sp. NPDC076911 TaxID=3154958 RepID=UPI00341663CC
MIQLALVRHAKSDWGSPELDDHDRPLNDRGRSDAPSMASKYARERFTPDVILSSTALRACTTAGFFAEALGMSLELQEQLYGAPASLLLTAAAKSGHCSVMVVAHDPGMSVLASHLSGERIQAMPTCAVATFAWDEDDWSAVDALEPVNWSFNTPR